MLHRKQSDREESVISSNEVNGDLFCMVNRASWNSSLLHLKRIPSPVCYFKTFRVVISHLTQKMRPYSLRVNVFKWSFSVLASRRKLRGSDWNVENVELYNCTFAQINESFTAVKVPGNVLRKKKTKKNTLMTRCLLTPLIRKLLLPILAFLTSSELHFKIILDTLTFFVQNILTFLLSQYCK